MIFRFAPVIRRHAKPYAVIRSGEGTWDADGVYQPSSDQCIPHSGLIQPIKSELLQSEGGRYTGDDRVLYTTSQHIEGDVVEYQGHRYTIAEEAPRDYVDVQKYTMKRVSTHDTIPSNTDSNGAGAIGSS
jgi:hypothetical protein